MVAEGPNMNIGIITHDNEIVVSFVPAAVPSRILHFSLRGMQSPTSQLD